MPRACLAAPTGEGDDNPGVARGIAGISIDGRIRVGRGISPGGSVPAPGICRLLGPGAGFCVVLPGGCESECCLLCRCEGAQTAVDTVDAREDLDAVQARHRYAPGIGRVRDHLDDRLAKVLDRD